MKSLLLFLQKYKAFITLLLLEAFCVILIVQNSHYHRALFFNSSNAAIASVLGVSNQIRNYFHLQEENDKLVKENTALRNLMKNFSRNPAAFQYDSVRQFSYIRARVIDNSVNKRHNLITINVGARHGIKKDMGVIGGGGIVGKTRYISDNFTLVTSLLHTETMVPALIKDKVNIATVQWRGDDPDYVDLLYVPRHYHIAPGDSVLTSGYSGIFPPYLPIGTVASATLRTDAQFYDIKVKLVNDFRTLTHVEVTQNLELPEIDSLKAQVP